MSKKLFIFRNEGIAALKEFRKNTDTVSHKYDQIYQDLWDDYLTELISIIKKYLNVEIRLHSLVELEAAKQKLLGSDYGISLDSYTSLPRTIRLGVSRLFKPGGSVKIGLGSRPGYKSIKNQLKSLDKAQDYSLIEDDIFSGGTLKEIMSLLVKNHLTVNKIIVGIQIAQKIDTSIPISAIFTYDPEEVLELVDPRDFLFGSFEGGLVVKIGSKSVRVPYLIPFVDVSARVSIPKASSKEFSFDIASLNKHFFENFYEKMGTDLSVSQGNQSFTWFIKKNYSSKEVSFIELSDFLISELRK